MTASVLAPDDAGDNPPLAQRARIANELLVFINEISVYDRAVLEMALRLYGESSLDFVDCLLISCNSLDRVRVVTFDKQLSKRLVDWR